MKIIEDEKLLQDMKKTQNLLVNLITHAPSKLEILFLRGNFLDDEIEIKIVEGLKNEENFIRDIILINRNLEEINLGNNSLTDESLDLIVKNYGIFKMTPEELEEYRKIEKEKQDIIKQNAKLKASKKPELKVPYLDEFKEINGEIFRFKNDILKVFNLIQNNFTQNSFNIIIK